MQQIAPHWTASVKPFRWDPEKYERLKVARGISHEETVLATVTARKRAVRWPERQAS